MLEGNALSTRFLTAAGPEGRESLAAYLERGGYCHHRDRSPEDILAAVEASGLRGRGGSGKGRPAGVRWREVRSGSPGKRYVVANGAETSPGSRKDRYLMERNPHRILDGAIAAARVVGASRIYLYIKATASEAIASMEQALSELTSAPPEGLELPEFELFRAPDTTVAGEETAVCDAIEGFEGRPQVKPPTPSTMGILGRPTLVTNVETLAAAAAVLREGPESFRSVGLPHAPGTALFTLTGDVRRPGVYELPLGTPIRTLIEECGGGTTAEPVAVLPGGYFSGPLAPDELDLPLEYDALAAVGSTLGAANVVVLSRPGDLADLMLGVLNLAAVGSCRQCPICAEGTRQLLRLADRISAGEDPGPLRQEMAQWVHLLHGKGNCDLPTAAAMLTRRALERFETWREGAPVGRHS